ncbi:MAG: hypothetical protein QGH83_06660 [Candidatus Pacebacteria bacterium]|jgi:hypothetical protein|nr:hypothetical protein [Candidatus Paceibacterota bacterium]
MEVEMDIECNNCNATYTMLYDSEDIHTTETTFHCAFCGILMEPEFFDDYE